MAVSAQEYYCRCVVTPCNLVDVDVFGSLSYNDIIIIIIIIIIIHLHYSICKALGTETTDKWYTHMPKPVCEEGDVTDLWNQAVHTEREVTANRPDIIIKNKKEKTYTLIDTGRQKCCAKGGEKKLKYKSLCIEMQRMWNLKCTIVPVIIGATGIVTRSLKKNFETVPGKHPIDSLQKTAILETSHIIRKVLQCEA